MTRTSTDVVTPQTHGDSRPVRYDLIDKDGHVLARGFPTRAKAARAAIVLCPDQQPAEDHNGIGWDVQTTRVNE